MKMMRLVEAYDRLDVRLKGEGVRAGISFSTVAVLRSSSELYGKSVLSIVTIEKSGDKIAR